MIALEAPEIRLGPRVVLRDVALALRAGELAAICGPNGAGKTTLLRALAGLLPGTPPRDPRRVAYLPQGARCAWRLTVREVAMLGRIPHGDSAGGPVMAALGACGAAPLADQRIDRLSGGQARRVMLARALATEPRALLLDEPLADLDPAAQHDVMALLRRTAESGVAVAVVLHGLDLVPRYAHRLLVLEAGRVVADGMPATALPRAATAFGLGWGSDPAPRLLAPCLLAPRLLVS